MFRADREQVDLRPFLRHQLRSLVFDTVGGDTLERSWRVLAPSGRMVTVSNDGTTSKDPRVRSAFFIVEPDRTQLEDLTDWIGEGILKP